MFNISEDLILYIISFTCLQDKLSLMVTDREFYNCVKNDIVSHSIEKRQNNFIDYNGHKLYSQSYVIYYTPFTDFTIDYSSNIANTVCIVLAIDRESYYKITFPRPNYRKDKNIFDYLRERLYCHRISLE